jgi:tRNA-modifying protein YgfZ
MTAPENSLFDLSSRIKLRISGADRVRFLNGQISNDLRKASASSAIEACVLNAKGKINAHLYLRAEPEFFLLDSDADIGSSLQARLERYIIADDVQIEDVTEKWSIFHVFGGSPPSDVAAKIVAVDRFGFAGHDLWVGSGAHEKTAAELAQHFQSLNAAEREILRIERGIPRWGLELTPEIIPLEANLEKRCIDYEKGCYVGQETISRMKMSGQRNKSLCGLVSLNDRPLTRGWRLSAAGKDAGWVTSATSSPQLSKQIGLAFVRRGFNSTGTKLEAGPAEGGSEAVPVEVADLPFAIPGRS